MNLTNFIKEDYIAGLCSVERGGTLIHMHFQMVVKGNLKSFLVLTKKIKVCLGWDESHPTDHVVSCKKLKDEGLHTYRGMLKYCMKDNGDAHFEFVHHNVLAEDMNDGKLEYVKLNKVGMNNCVSLSHSNILQRVSSMGWILYDEAFGGHSYEDFVSHVQGRSILPQSDMGDTIEVCRDGCEACGLLMENYDESK